MKKFFIGLIILIIIITAAIFVLLFTSFGNGILKPQLQSQINKISPINLDLDVFVLRLGSFEFELNSNNVNIASSGTFSILNQNIDGILNVRIKNHLKIAQIEQTGIDLGNDFLIENVIRGKFTDININTKSNIANGDLRIDTIIEKFKPTKIVANINNVQISSLLSTLGQKPYASGNINLTADIVGDDKFQFTGKADATFSNGTISQDLVKQDFNLNIPNTTFVVNLSALFDVVSVNHKLEFLSNVGNINSTGNTIIKTLKTSSIYDVNISDLSPFTPFVGVPLMGSFRTDGRIAGNSKWMNIEGKSDFASGNTNYSVSLEGYTKPKDALVTIKNIKLEDVLYTLVKPIYAKGFLNANADFKGISTAINGTYTHSLSGNIQKDIIKKEFDINMPNDLGYINRVNSVFNNGNGLVNADVLSDIASFTIKNSVLDLERTLISMPYTIEIPDLKKVAFITSKELKGAIKANGDIKYKPNAFYADFKSALFGGNLEAVLNNNTFHVSIKNMDSLSVLDMLQYPKFFKSNINGNIKYDTNALKGDIELMLNQGSFVENKFTNLLDKVVNFSVLKELYDSIKIKGDIDKKLVTTNLHMISKNTSITSKNAKVDFENDNIDANLLLKIQKYELGAVLSGSIMNPNIKIDTQELGKDIVKNILQNEKLQDQKDKIQEEVKDKITDGLKKIFNK